MEKVLAPHSKKRLRVSRIQRHAQLIQPRINQLLVLLRRQQRAIRIEQHIHAAILQITDHPRQRLHHHRLAHAMQHDTRHVRHLIDNRREQLPAHVRRRLQRLERARTRLAQQIAAIGDLQVQAHRRRIGVRLALRLHRLEIAARILQRRRGHHALRMIWCDIGRRRSSNKARIAAGTYTAPGTTRVSTAP